LLASLSAEARARVLPDLKWLESRVVDPALADALLGAEAAAPTPAASLDAVIGVLATLSPALTAQYLRGEPASLRKVLLSQLPGTSHAAVAALLAAEGEPAPRLVETVRTLVAERAAAGVSPPLPFAVQLDRAAAA
jgi:hypothetical protein